MAAAALDAATFLDVDGGDTRGSIEETESANRYTLCYTTCRCYMQLTSPGFLFGLRALTTLADPSLARCQRRRRGR